MSDMNAEEAFRKDKEFAEEHDADPTYIAYDEGEKDWAVFGVTTGFCYLLSGKEDCMEERDKLNDSM